MVSSEIEKRDFKTLTCKEALFHVAKMLHKSHEMDSEKHYELELSWITEGTNFVH